MFRTNGKYFDYSIFTVTDDFSTSMIADPFTIATTQFGCMCDLHYDLVNSSLRGLLAGNIPSLDVTGNVPSLDVTGNIPSLDVTGNVPSLDVTGNVPSLDVTGTVHSLLMHIFRSSFYHDTDRDVASW